jgi:glycosidase
VPFIYYGEEIGMTGNKPDELIRTPMQWSGAANAGFTNVQPWQPVNRGFEKLNVAAQYANPDSLLSHYRRLIHLRNGHEALRRGAFIPVESSCDSTLAYLRQAPAGHAETPNGQAALVVLNVARKRPQRDCTFSYSGDSLPSGTFQMTDLLGGASVAPLTVTADGFQGYAPLSSLAVM